MIFIDEERCTGCGLCLDACVQGAIALGEGGATIDQSLCSGCAACVAACPQAAIYEVEPAPVAMVAVSTEAQPTQGALARWQPTLIRARPAIASTLAAAAPLAVDVLAGLARRWLDERSMARSAGGWSAPGGGRCRRRRRGGRRC
jgi:MinD superfamily P-loop ATPase